MNNLDLELELEYDLIDKKDTDIISSNDIQNDMDTSKILCNIDNNNKI